MTIALHMADGPVDAIHAFKAYTAMYAEGLVPGTFSAQKALTNVLRFVNGPDSVVMLAMDGAQCAGVLTLVKSGCWYSETSRVMEDKGFYVLPTYRGGDARRVLLQGAIDLSDDTGLPVFITVNNGRRKRGTRSDWERIGVTLGYENRGATLAHFPAEKE